MAIKIYTDGSCLGNPGVGGWAAIIIDESGDHTEISGGEAKTTSNRMELTAAICALEKISAGSHIEIFSDSSYLKNAFTQGWIIKWKSNGWKTSTKSPVINKDLWLKLDKLVSIHKVNFNWVKGHAGNILNERCDKLAKAHAEKIRRAIRISPPEPPPPKEESNNPLQLSLFD